MKLNHPTLANVSVDVPKGDVEAWQAAGWVAGSTKKPAAPESTETPADVPAPE